MKRDEVIGSVIREMEGESRFGCCELPDRKRIVDIISDVQAFMFPAFCEESVSGRMLLERIGWELARQIRRALKFDGRVTLDPEEAADKFVLEIPRSIACSKRTSKRFTRAIPPRRAARRSLSHIPDFLRFWSIASHMYCMKCAFRSCRAS